MAGQGFVHHTAVRPRTAKTTLATKPWKYRTNLRASHAGAIRPEAADLVAG